MALCMEAGSEPKTDREATDLQAISALKQLECVKMEKKHYSDAIDCYTRGINQRRLWVMQSSQLSIQTEPMLICSLVIIDMLSRMLKRQPNFAQQMLRHFMKHSNCHCLSNKLAESNFYCKKKQSPDSEELKNLTKQIDLWKSENEQW